MKKILAVFVFFATMITWAIPGGPPGPPGLPVDTDMWILWVAVLFIFGLLYFFRSRKRHARS